MRQDLHYLGGQFQVSNLWLVLEQQKQAEANDYDPTLHHLPEHSGIPGVSFTGALFCKRGLRDGCFLPFWNLMPSWLFLSDPEKKKRVAL